MALILLVCSCCFCSWDGSAEIAGNQTQTLKVSTWQIPLFVPANVVVPLKTSGTAADVVPPITWTLWAGSNSTTSTAQGMPRSRVRGQPRLTLVSGQLYEDDGTTTAYQAMSDAVRAVTEARCKAAPNAVVCVVTATAALPGFPSTRAHRLQVRGPWAASRSSLAATVNGQPATVSRCAAPGGGGRLFGLPGHGLSFALAGTLVCPQNAIWVDAGALPLSATVTFNITAL